jgi:hypothetical protein
LVARGKAFALQELCLVSYKHAAACMRLALASPSNLLLNTSLTFHRRLARRGGVKRIAATIYDDVRKALKDRLAAVSHEQPLEEPQLTNPRYSKTPSPLWNSLAARP